MVLIEVSMSPHLSGECCISLDLPIGQHKCSDRISFDSLILLEQSQQAFSIPIPNLDAINLRLECQRRFWKPMHKIARSTYGNSDD